MPTEPAVDQPGHYGRDGGRTVADADMLDQDAGTQWHVPEPPHPVGQLTTFELINYRRALDAVARAAPAGHPVHDRLGHRVGQVLAEQDRRAQAAREACADEAARARRRDALHA